MVSLKKYNTNVILNTNNLIKYDYVFNFTHKCSLKVNYIFKKNNKIIRSFLSIHSIFFIFLNFNQTIYNSNLEFRLNINNSLFLLIDSSYDNYSI